MSSIPKKHDLLEAEILDIPSLESGHQDFVTPRLIRYRYSVWVCFWRCFADLGTRMSRYGDDRETDPYLGQNLRYI